MTPQKSNTRVERRHNRMVLSAMHRVGELSLALPTMASKAAARHQTQAGCHHDFSRQPVRGRRAASQLVIFKSGTHLTHALYELQLPACHSSPSIHIVEWAQECEARAPGLERSGSAGDCRVLRFVRRSCYVIAGRRVTRPNRCLKGPPREQFRLKFVAQALPVTTNNSAIRVWP